jgi:DNA-directed RNA polymerase subunit RPC12/RpoP
MEKIRKNSKPVWYPFKSTYCLSCGTPFDSNETILSGKFCSTCSTKKERELKIDKEEIYFTVFHSVCVKCAKPFGSDDPTLFGVYCKSCGKKWVKERKLRQARLKKSRGL